MRRNITNPYGELSKRKSAENIDAALQHSHISARRDRPIVGGGVLGKQTKMTKSMHALGAASMLVAMAAAGAAPARADTMTAKDILSSFNLVTTGNCVDAFRRRGQRCCRRRPQRSDLLWRRLEYSVLADPLPVREAEQLAQPQFGRQPVLCRRRASPKVNYNGGGKLHTTLPNPIGYYTDPLADLSDSAFRPDRDDRNVVRQWQVQRGLEHRHRRVRDQRIAARQRPREPRHQLHGGTGVTSYIINVIGNFTDPNSTHFNVDQQNALFNFEDATHGQSRAVGRFDPGA